MKTFVTILHVIFSLLVIISVFMQPSKVYGLSTTISGGAETFFGKNKSRTIEAKLQRVTIISMVLFAITSIILVYLANK
ncbi:preprotein translocase subunit SecG [Thermobrachium celere]|uniref:Protein-export membrane protein SecG n=1 Tax=Thermobrachium celere DSM 8682 TaxID=941824 RepID=R7RTC6_9CLOT|nr:preprotein translocase subunit SecG [Thermobrachium celere]GFR35487.1 preprotein translocase subunit SecG [Thermobrachium celere]CDF58651.1 Preprotein translocase subunit SecG (TC 3.A.5.1.1) [Thermobrachium celere DSM 8682]